MSDTASSIEQMGIIFSTSSLRIDNCYILNRLSDLQYKRRSGFVKYPGAHTLLIEIITQDRDIHHIRTTEITEIPILITHVCGTGISSADLQISDKPGKSVVIKNFPVLKDCKYTDFGMTVHELKGPVLSHYIHGSRIRIG